MKKVSYQNELSHSQTKISWIFGWKRKALWYLLCQGRIVRLTLFLSSLLPEKRIHIQALALYQCWTLSFLIIISLGDSIFELIIFSNKSILPTCVPWSLLATLCLGHGLKTVFAILPLSNHYIFVAKPKNYWGHHNSSLFCYTFLSITFATKFSNGLALLPLVLLAPFHWSLIRWKKDLSFCLQGYQINMNIGSSDRLGKTCRPCRPFLANANFSCF